ncbi:integumentary mucin C.1-like [Bicyclus anynana]|uniref:Integumentary mucin C.1-like n=1 Tax=Bicyclus anynana TaxID=110368 RepID=A0A6J1MV23_BICAN|nr:integumentary mucin C.1-like [Bicyclus anynana]
MIVFQKRSKQHAKMVSLRLFFLPLLCMLSAVIQAQALECYQCPDCASDYETSAKTCQAPDNGGSSTVPPVTTSPAETTTSSPAETTTTGPAETTTTGPAETTTTGPAETTTTNPAETTTTGPAETTTTGPAETTTAITTEPTNTDEDNNVVTQPPTQQQSDPIVVEAQSRVRRSARQFRANATVVCVVTSFQVNGTDQIHRGCSFGDGLTDDARCRNVIGSNFTGTLGRCNVCETDRCNSGTKAAIAFVPLLIGIFIHSL